MPVTNQPWVEKYRPKTLDQVESQQDAVRALQHVLASGASMPHLLFYGPAGTGKTSTILALSRQLFGPDYLKSRVRELNASDERGIGFVRDKVKQFAQGIAVTIPSVVQSDGQTYSVPGYKLLILDEADALLPDAQGAIRRMMEDYSRETRFCLICNYVTRIIDPVASRCARYRFGAIPLVSSVQRLCNISNAEGLTLAEETIEHLARKCRGDLRASINLLQALSRSNVDDGCREMSHSTELSVVNELTGHVPSELISQLIVSSIGSSSSVVSIRDAVDKIIHQGYSGLCVLKQLCELLSSPIDSFPIEVREHVSCTLRSIFALKLMQTERQMLSGADESLQLMSLCSTNL